MVPLVRQALKPLILCSFVFFCFLSVPTPGFSCTHPASHYELSSEYKCLGSWAQTVDILSGLSVITCYDTQGTVIFTQQTPMAFLNSFSEPATLKKSGCERYLGRARVKLVLSRQQSGVFSKDIWNSGDIYGK